MSPSGLVSVCHGDQLELSCTTTGNFLEWRIRLHENSYPRLLTTTSVTSNLSVGGILFTFTRNSMLDSVPLISVLSVSSAVTSLNGTIVNCIDIETDISSSTEVIVINERTYQGMYMVRSRLDRSVELHTHTFR